MDQRTDPTTAPTTLLIDCDKTGFFGRDTEKGFMIYHVRWNKARSARYASALAPPRPTPSRPEVMARLDYLGQGPLHELTVADQISSTTVLRTVAQNAPYDTCMWCRRSLDEPLTQHFGMGRHCATKHMHLPRKVLEVLFRHNPPTGPGTPRSLPTSEPVTSEPRRGHLRLVAVNGELVAA